jgi:hypothetical protein
MPVACGPNRAHGDRPRCSLAESSTSLAVPSNGPVFIRPGRDAFRDVRSAVEAGRDPYVFKTVSKTNLQTDVYQSTSKNERVELGSAEGAIHRGIPGYWFGICWKTQRTDN